MVVDRLIFKNNQITLFPCFTFIPNAGVGLPKTDVGFYSVLLKMAETVYFSYCHGAIVS